MAIFYAICTKGFCKRGPVGYSQGPSRWRKAHPLRVYQFSGPDMDGDYFNSELGYVTTLEVRSDELHGFPLFSEHFIVLPKDQGVRLLAAQESA